MDFSISATCTMLISILWSRRRAASENTISYRWAWLRNLSNIPALFQTCSACSRTLAVSLWCFSSFFTWWLNRGLNSTSCWRRCRSYTHTNQRLITTSAAPTSNGENRRRGFSPSKKRKACCKLQNWMFGISLACFVTIFAADCRSMSLTLRIWLIGGSLLAKNDWMKN